jgi:carbamate kinase
VDRLTIGEARRYLEDGTHFGAGSMQPKIEACIWYLERAGGRAIITSPDQMEAALDGRAGTAIVPD